MKKNKKIWIAMIILVTPFLFWGYSIFQNMYVEYIPIVSFGGPDHLRVPMPPLAKSEGHIKSMKKILSGYSVDYKVRNGVLYIRRRLASDKGLLYNYTMKAEVGTERGDHPAPPKYKPSSVYFDKAREILTYYDENGDIYAQIKWNDWKNSVFPPGVNP